MSAMQLKEAVERSIQLQLAGLNDIEPGFSQAVRAFYQGKIECDSEMSSHALAWITGSRSLSAQSLRAIGVKGYLEPHTVFQRVQGFETDNRLTHAYKTFMQQWGDNSF